MCHFPHVLRSPTFHTRYASISGEVSEWNTTVVTASSPIVISEEGKNDSYPIPIIPFSALIALGTIYDFSHCDMK